VKRLVLAALLAALAGVSTVARADTPPSKWECAKDPAVCERYALHLHVQEYMYPPGPDVRKIREALLERARAELEAASAATSPDVRLRFDLGEVYQGLRHYEEAARVLEPALAMAPRHSAALRAWRALADAAAHLERARQELDAYDAYLSLAPDDPWTLEVLGNRAEAEMRLGNLEQAVAGYRDVIERIEHAPFGQVEDFDVLVLARWGLAVALDRSGDSGDAQHEASVVAQQDPDERIIGRTEEEGVFFRPEYERDWYLALGRGEHARQATDARDAMVKWSRVVQTWADYVRRASPDDRWVGLARAHLASAEAERDRAEARVVRSGKGR